MVSKARIAAVYLGALRVDERLVFHFKDMKKPFSRPFGVSLRVLSISVCGWKLFSQQKNIRTEQKL